MLSHQQGNRRNNCQKQAGTNGWASGKDEFYNENLVSVKKRYVLDVVLVVARLKDGTLCLL
jgi:hypothetical protein